MAEFQESEPFEPGNMIYLFFWLAAVVMYADRKHTQNEQKRQQ